MTTAPNEILTLNAHLRRLSKDHSADFSAMNSDPQVMEFFPRPLSIEESQSILEGIEREFADRGFGIYAVEVETEFAGVVGLSIPSFQAYFTPCVEILWRFRPRFWGRGIASEAAAAVLQMAFDTLLMPEVVAFAVMDNLRSIRVMERVGMKRDQRAYFDHPDVTDARLRRHVLYRATPAPCIPD